MIRATGCPNCLFSLHYLTDYDDALCTECGWCEGDEYSYRPIPIGWDEWQIITQMLKLQVRNRTLSIEDYTHIMEYELCLEKIV